MSDAGEVAKTFLGTMVYMSPERADGKPYSFSSDLWSTGLVAYELATGSFPFPPMSDFLQLHEALFHAPEPRLPATFSSEAQAFVAAQLLRDAGARASAEELLQHAFLAASGRAAPREDLARWLRARQAGAP